MLKIVQGNPQIKKYAIPAVGQNLLRVQRELLLAQSLPTYNKQQLLLL